MSAPDEKRPMREQSNQGSTVIVGALLVATTRVGRHPDMKSTDDELLTPREVATLFGVGLTTVKRWTQAGKLSESRTLLGHRRYRADEIRQQLLSVTEELIRLDPDEQVIRLDPV
jgi:excisionase family DNA binding protein